MTAGRVVLASDHGGYHLKEALKRHLTGRGLDVLDVGTHSTDACDYPVFARAAAEAVATGQASRGIIIDGAGIGSGMVANKIPGVRSAMAFDEKTANNAREHNDANVLTLGAGYLSEDQARRIADVFVSVDCTVDRHKRRVAMIDALDAHKPAATFTPPTAPARAAATAPTGSPPMASSGSTYDGLVTQITQILTANPALFASFGGGGAPGNVCTTCNKCSGHCASQAPDTVRHMISGPVAGNCRVSNGVGTGPVPQDLAGFIDHTLLKPEATYDEIDRLCDEAMQCGFKSVCVNPLYVRRCADRMRGAKPVVCTVIGFPLGATPKEVKALEARRALRDGAKELDMVIAIGALKSGDLDYVYEDIRLVAEVAREGGALSKVIIETALLTDEEKIAACVIAKRARADFVKTSTGFAKGGATAEDVALMARAVDYKLEVKASGGVRNSDDARKMVAAGATRIGASVGLKIAGCEVPWASGASAY